MQGSFDVPQSTYNTWDKPQAPAHADPAKLARASEAYRAFRAGEIEPAALPDLRDVFPEDEALLAEMGVMTTPGASGEAVLLEACSLCHNPRLEQSLSRARFRADLVGLDRAEKDLAVQRLQLPPEHPAAMPPARLRTLSPTARARAIEALRR
jgi:mono/diheme cytochrome c family protein